MNLDISFSSEWPHGSSLTQSDGPDPPPSYLIVAKLHRGFDEAEEPKNNKKSIKPQDYRAEKKIKINSSPKKST